MKVLIGKRLMVSNPKRGTRIFAQSLVRRGGKPGRVLCSVRRWFFHHRKTG